MRRVESKVVAVTVYTDRARITRQAVVALAAGEETLELTGMPVEMDRDSVRVGGRGAGVRLLGVETGIEHVDDTPEENVRELERQLEALRDERRAARHRRNGIQSQIEMLKALLGNSGQSWAKAIQLGRATVDTAEAVGTFVTREWEPAHEKLRAVEAEIRAVSRKVAAAEARLESVRPMARAERPAIRIPVEAAAPVELQLEVSYFVKRAGWTPLYDLRLTGESLAVSYMAMVRQQTGEEWAGVRLSLSTARQAGLREIPELAAWFVAPFAPRAPQAPMFARSMAAPLPPAAAAPQDALAMLAGASLEGHAIPVPPPVELETAVPASGRGGGGGVTWEVRRPSTIPPDGQPHRVLIGSSEFPARIDFVTAPRLTEEVYVRARVTNNSNQLLLAAEANVFHEDNFAGKTKIDTVAPGEEFELQLGIEERIRVERKLAARSTGKTLMGGARREQFAYTILVENLLDRPVKLTVLDQIPVSRHEDIKVKLEQSSPTAEQDDLNRLEWRLPLGARAKAEIQFAFLVESPREMRLAGLEQG